MNGQLIPIIAILGDKLSTVLLAAVVILGPVWLCTYYGTKGRLARQMSLRDRAALAQVNQALAGMEQRMKALEGILEAEVPDWREKLSMGAEYGTMG